MIRSAISDSLLKANGKKFQSTQSVHKPSNGCARPAVLSRSQIPSFQCPMSAIGDRPVNSLFQSLRVLVPGLPRTGVDDDGVLGPVGTQCKIIHSYNVIIFHLAFSLCRLVSFCLEDKRRRLAGARARRKGFMGNPPSEKEAGHSV